LEKFEVNRNFREHIQTSAHEANPELVPEKPGNCRFCSAGVKTDFSIFKYYFINMLIISYLTNHKFKKKAQHI